MIGDLNETQMVRVLQTQAVGRIGCYAKDRTYVVPVAYAYADGYIYCHSGLGMKIEMMRANPHVCFEVDEVDEHAPGSWRSVVAEGVFEELHGLAAARALALLTRRFISRTGRSRPKRRPTGRTVAFRIRVERMTGREVTR